MTAAQAGSAAFLKNPPGLGVGLTQQERVTGAAALAAALARVRRRAAA